MTGIQAILGDAELRASRQKRAFTLVELLVVIGIIAILIAFLAPARRSARPAARRAQCNNNLKQIALALQTYEDLNHAFPPAYTIDENGNRLHSWRTLILPYLEQRPLYNLIDLSKPWNDPANAKAYQATVPAYSCPSADCPQNYTPYLTIVAPDSCLRPIESRSLSDISDDLASTLTVIEIDSQHAVHWMSPTDADENLLLGYTSISVLPHAGGLHAAFVDGHVNFLSLDMPASERRALITIAGNDK